MSGTLDATPAAGWAAALAGAVAAGEACVLVTVARSRGSAPRERGAWLLVTAARTLGSIGGGTLEYRATELARAQLSAAGTAASLRRFPLGPELGQCCGGVVWLAFEPVAAGSAGALILAPALAGGAQVVRVTALDGECPGILGYLPEGAGASVLPGLQPAGPLPAGLHRAAIETARHGGLAMPVLAGRQYLLHASRPASTPLYLFGAGHVGRALVDLLAALPFAVTWVDSRPDALARALPGNVAAMPRSAPAYAVAGAPAGAFYLIMTHSHALDLEICERVLARGDARYCGLIGSASKRRRFERQLRAAGVATDGLTCPIGVPGIDGKQPAQIAVAVAAQLLQGLAARAEPAASTAALEE